VTVTLPTGQTIDGELERVDDFAVSLKTSDGGRRSFRIVQGMQVKVADPLQSHKDLLPTYTDAEIHNVTAYLATLK